MGRAPRRIERGPVQVDGSRPGHDGNSSHHESTNQHRGRSPRRVRVPYIDVGALGHQVAMRHARQQLVVS
jgi:hypothetical protein